MTMLAARELHRWQDMGRTCVRVGAPLHQIAPPLVTPFGVWLDPLEYRIVREDPWLLLALNDCRFRDAHGRIHTIKRGTFSDGASMPYVAERLLGSRKRPEWRRACFLHDQECEDKRRPMREVHDRFYAALRADGVTHPRARIMHVGVLAFGP